MPNPDSEVHNLMQRVYEVARKMIVETDVELMPQFFAIMPDGMMHVYATPWSDDHEKECMLEMLRQDFAKKNVKAYVLVTEAWESRQTEVAPMLDDARKEILMLIGVERNGTVSMASSDIERNGDQRTCTELKWQSTDGSGLMASLFGDEEIVPGVHTVSQKKTAHTVH